MDLEAALEWIGKQAVAASMPKPVVFDDTKCHAVFKQNGEFEVIPGVRPWRDHHALDLATIVAFAKRFKTDKPSIWYHRSGVVCLVNDSDRREKVSFALSYSPQLVELQNLEKKQAIDQRAIIMLLRTTFKNCLSRCPKLIDTLRSIKWGVAKDGQSDIGRGKSSIGQSLRAELTGIEAIPEYVTLSVPIFANGSLAFIQSDVECVIEPLEQNQSFQLFPVPGALELAIANAEGLIEQAVKGSFAAKDDSIPVYYGTP